MNEDKTIDNVEKIVVTLDYLPRINYAMINSGIEACSSLIVENKDDRDWNKIKISITGEYVKESLCCYEYLGNKTSLQVNEVKIIPDIKILSDITESIKTSFRLLLEEENGVLFDKEYPITLLAYDEWAGSSIMPEHIAAFVVPNNPLLSRIMVSAAKFLEVWTGSSAFDEYQTQDRNRVRAQVAAIYEALRSEGIIYSAPPASFEETGQRIRLADKVLTEKIGTCIDTSLLIASCLEAAYIYPIIVVLRGHVLVGAWLTPNLFHHAVCDDSSYLLKEIADGNNNIVLLESTAITSSDHISFEDAVKSAVRKVGDDNIFQYFVDIHRCRLDNILPIPQRIMKDGAWEFVNEGVEHVNATRRVDEYNHYDLKPNCDLGKLTKQMIWERKLLDFSLRNNLLNTRLGRKVVPFISFNIEHLEDHLQNGEDYTILPAPGKKIVPNDDGMYNSYTQALELQNYVSEMISSNKIASYLTETELQLALKHLYRTSRTSIEENGANSLFLALGMLRWYETEKSIQPRYAPILLLPVDIIRRSGNVYVIRKRDEDIILNITLVEYLKQNFKINLDLLKELPKDDSGVDVKKIFTIIRRAIMEQKKWNVQEESMLGLFSFNKFVMWNDIHTNADKLKENIVVSSLIANENKQTLDGDLLDAREIDKTKEPQEFAIPMDVDSSQMEAIVESGRGKSFILHGPPGTGKSQTITNMIANALYQGKRVLFVAEKMAALSVVQARLEKLHLAPFCLELHSNKATKKHFLEQMDEVLSIRKITPPEGYDQNSKELFGQRKELIANMESLHKRGVSGYSLYDCITEYLSIDEDEIIDNLPDIKVFNTSFVEKTRSAIEEILSVVEISGNPCGHPLIKLVPKDNRLETIESIKNTLIDLKSSLSDLNNQIKRVEDTTSFKVGNEKDFGWLKKLADLISKVEIMNKAYLDLGIDDLTRATFIKDVELGKQYKTKKEEILSAYTDNILEINADGYRNQYDEILDKWFIPRFFAKRKFFKGLRQYGAITEDNLYTVLSDVKDCQTKRKDLDKMAPMLSNVFGLLALRDDEQWDEILEHLEIIPEFSELLSEYSNAHEIKYKECADLFMNSIDGQWSVYKKDTKEKVNSVIEVFDHITTSKSKFLELTEEDLSLGTIKEELEQWLANYDRIKDWYYWIAKKKELKSLNLQVVADKVEGGLNAIVAVNGVLKGLFHQLIIRTIDESEQLRMFNGSLFRQSIARYKDNTKKFQELSKRELYSRLAARVPSTSGMAEGSEVSILKRNIANGGRGTSIRGIIDSIPNLLPRLCPCMLMSPISVAQYIDLNNEKFDLVIFDEASQMPTSEAVGAIARGKALVVVGDRKQMPPTSFFSSTQVDEEEADIDDMESILDDCITLSLPEYKLQWHYRSKHESLIAFSNSQYYNNELYTFPSVDDQKAKVKLVPIKGVYDKGRTRSNPEEAKAIVKEIIRRLSDKELCKSSIGVVAFSKVQGDLIEDELLEQLDKHQDLKELAYDVKEPIFIKNLENVQGDERDVIFFSIGYGADMYGKVSMNFGPLNNVGGERRLNVAVSRARKEMLVFSSLSSSQIDLKRSQAKGVEGLKGFLEFAETGRLPLVVNSISDNSNNNMIDQLCKALNECGYCTKEHVGRSNFKVDIAVSTKDNPEKYILGILCDGKSYFETKTTRDREIVQPSILEMLDWKVMRVYSIDWYDNKEKTMSQIINELEALQNEEEKEDADEPEKEEYKFCVDNVGENEIVKDILRDECRRSYLEANVHWYKVNPEYFSPYSTDNFELVKGIIEKEQPVNENYLCKLIAKAMGFGHAGSNIQKLVSFANERDVIFKDPIQIGKYCYYWLDKESSQDYNTYRSPSPRSILEIPAIEIINAIKELVREEYSLPLDKIPTLTAKKFGFSGAGKAISTTVKEIVNYMLKINIIELKGDYVCLSETD